MRKKSGFTLLELMVVIAIISIVAAITIPALVRAKNKALDASIKSEIGKAKPNLEVTPELIQRIKEIADNQQRWIPEAVTIALNESSDSQPKKVESEKSDPNPSAAPPPTEVKTPQPETVAATQPNEATTKPAKSEPEKNPQTPAPPADLVNGVIVYKAEIHYGDGDKEITEYWFYVRKFDNAKANPTYDNNPPAWIKVESHIFQLKDVGQTYHSQDNVPTSGQPPTR